MGRKSRRKGSVLLVWAATLGAVLFVAAGWAFYRFAQRRVAPLLTGEWRARYTSRIYAAPLRLKRGDALSPEELRERLRRLGYRPAEGSPAPGEYVEAGESFEIHIRPFDHPFVGSTPTPVRLTLKEGQVESLREAGSRARVLEAVLEPELLYETSGAGRERHEPLRLEDIPPAMVQALVSVEDRRFYSHHGVDPRAIARAAVRNVRGGRIREGGSTLTQQLAKRLFLDPRRTFTRKFQEALIALYLDARYSKEDILLLYLDNVYFGRNGPISIVGLTAAARHFFDKPPRRLTVSESALLAGLLQSPNNYNPFVHPEEALRRRRVVLGEMKEAGYLDERAELKARLEPLRITREGQREPGEADYFVNFVRRRLEGRYDDEALFARGLTVHTTLDPWAQKHAQEAVARAPHQAALVALDPRTGAIRALVGGKNFRESPFDRATQARRQPGSAFKPFVYGAALRQPRPDGRPWTMTSLIPDATREFRVEAGTWSPRNYDLRYRGEVPLREALSLSLNAATVNLASEIGPRKVIDYARLLGVESPMRPELGLALGAFEVSLLELTGAYCAFANGGFRVEPYGVEAVLDADGFVLEHRVPDPRPVLSPAEAYLMSSLLREAVRSGTGRALGAMGLGEVSAGKTGTTDLGRDAWFVGFTPRLAAGVWVGSDQPQPLGLWGGSAALPVWGRFMRAAGLPPPAADPDDLWPRPEEVVSVEIDPESGLVARSGCLKRRRETYIKGTEPAEDCPLHAGGVSGWFKRVFGD